MKAEPKRGLFAAVYGIVKRAGRPMTIAEVAAEATPFISAAKAASADRAETAEQRRKRSGARGHRRGWTQPLGDRTGDRAEPGTPGIDPARGECAGARRPCSRSLPRPRRGSSAGYRFEYWNFCRAPGCPYFLRSRIRGSRVSRPAFFSGWRSFSSNCDGPTERLKWRYSFSANSGRPS